MTWVVLLTASGALTLGWVARGWLCSRRADCPLYTQYALAKWKREVVEPAVRYGRRRAIRSRTTPAEGVKP